MATKVNYTDRKVKATSFADPADIRAFKRCKNAGGTDQECFAKGDNGIGLWNQSCAEGTGPCCAIPPDDMIEQWGSINAAKNKLVKVTLFSRPGLKHDDVSVICDVRDRMPWKKYIKNGAGIDLNPDACEALDLTPPVSTTVTWRWIEVRKATEP
jgi:hypothetical protein